MKKVSIFIFLLFYPFIAISNLLLDGSRVILYQSDKEASLMIKNTEKYPVIVQSWVDNGDPANTPETITDVSALSLPPILKLKSNEAQQIRIINKFTNTVQDRESLYWLNLLEITPKQDGQYQEDNLINVTIRLQIKVFYRSDNLNMSISERSNAILFKKIDNQLFIENPTPFYITVQSASIDDNSTILLPMLPPFSKQKITVENKKITRIKYILLDDWGNAFSDEKKLD